MIRKLLLAIAALVLVGAGLLLGWYRIDGQPLPEARGYLQGTGYSAVESADGSLEFSPATPNGRGLLIMHGALIKPLAYSKTAAAFAALGYRVRVPAGAMRLSINAVDAAAADIAASGIRDWYLIGHSMGGFSGLKVQSLRPERVRAVALWAAAMPSDFSTVSVPILFLHGDHDGLLPPERLADAKSKLPATTQYRVVAGGNHQNFAMYSHQFFDSAATIGWEQQIDFAVAETAKFFAAH